MVSLWGLPLRQVFCSDAAPARQTTVRRPHAQDNGRHSVPIPGFPGFSNPLATLPRPTEEESGRVASGQEASD